MKTRRFICALICAVMIFALVPVFSSFADGAVLFHAADEEVGLGSKIVVTVYAKNVPKSGICSAIIGVRFDKRLTFDRSLSNVSSALGGQRTVGTKDIDRGELFERRFMWVDDGDGMNEDFVFATAVFTVPEATYLAWVDLRAYLPDGMDLPDFFAKKAGVILEGGNAFFVDDAEGCVRLNLALPRALLKTGLERMRDAILSF